MMEDERSKMKDSNVSKIIFPLRSNVAWFESRRKKLNLEAKIKQALLIFDELLFEDGTFEVTFWENSAPETYVPPGNIEPSMRLKFDFIRKKPKNGFAAIQPFGAGKGQVFTISSGKIIEYFKADYYRILQDMKAEEHDFISTIVYELDTNHEKIIPDLCIRDKKKKRILPSISNRHIRNCIVKGLNTDLVVSATSRTPIIIDSIHKSLIAQKQKDTFFTLEKIFSRKQAIQNDIIQLSIPDFSEKTWDEIIEIRNHPLFVSLRNANKNMTRFIMEEKELLCFPKDLKNEIEKKVPPDLIFEIGKLEKSKGKMYLSLIWNLLSIASPIGKIDSGARLYRDIKGIFKKSDLYYIFFMDIEDNE